MLAHTTQRKRLLIYCKRMQLRKSHMVEVHRARYGERTQGYYVLSKPLCPNLHLFTKLQALQAPSFWIFVWCVLSHSVMYDSVTPWTVAHQAPLSMGFSGQEYWSGLLFPSPGDLPDPGIKPMSPSLQGDYLPSEPREGPFGFLWRLYYTGMIKSLITGDCFKV